MELVKLLEQFNYIPSSNRLNCFCIGYQKTYTGICIMPQCPAELRESITSAVIQFCSDNSLEYEYHNRLLIIPNYTTGNGKEN